MAYLGEDIPKLGFGLMRLPMDGKNVDIEQTKQMADIFLQKGFTYFDTAYGYINGKSEEAVKAALTDRYPRERYQLATKLPAWNGPTNAREAQDMFWTSLKRTGAGYFDFYLLHNLGKGRTEAFERFGIWDFLAERKAEGLIKHLGFSAHTTADDLDKILTQHPEMEFVQLQINYADQENKTIQSRRCYETARKHGKPVIIMEPLKGGALANLPEQAAEVLTAANPDASPASWALRYAASFEGVITVLSGMSTLGQMQENLAIMGDYQPLSKDELAALERVRTILESIPQIACTGCEYCLKGCPKNIAIPGTLTVMNDYLIYKDPHRARQSYAWVTLKLKKASECIACGKCETVCPQSLPIIEELSKAAALLERK